MKCERSTAGTFVSVVTGCIVFMAGVVPAAAQYGEMYAFTDASQLVSVYCRPDGSGQPLSAVYGYGGTTVDATIHVFMLDIYGNPIQGFPREDIWLEGPPGSAYVYCIGGNLADGPTDQNGHTTFAQAIQAGGHLFSDSSPGGLTVMINGWVIDCWNLWQISLNSPDIDGDLTVNIADAALFSQHYFGSYDYRADFVWDGNIDLADVAAFTQGLGTTCP